MFICYTYFKAFQKFHLWLCYVMWPGGYERDDDLNCVSIAKNRVVIDNYLHDMSNFEQKLLNEDFILTYCNLKSCICDTHQDVIIKTFLKAFNSMLFKLVKQFQFPNHYKNSCFHLCWRMKRLRVADSFSPYCAIPLLPHSTSPSSSFFFPMSIRPCRLIVQHQLLPWWDH